MQMSKIEPLRRPSKVTADEVGASLVTDQASMDHVITQNDVSTNIPTIDLLLESSTILDPRTTGYGSETQSTKIQAIGPSWPAERLIGVPRCSTIIGGKWKWPSAPH
jgi:hypothetical protein